MIVQACLNGARRNDFHPRLPLTAEAMALDGASCITAGSAELHLHPRGPDGQERLWAVDTAGHHRTASSARIGVEAGLASVPDAERLIKLPDHGRVFRVLIEIDEQNLDVTRRVVDEIAALLDRASMRRPVLLHGLDATVWPFVELARRRRWSTRVGLEDGKHLPNGAIASDNAALVAAAVEIFSTTAVG